MADWLIAVTFFLGGGALTWLLRGSLAAARTGALRGRIDELGGQLAEERRELEVAREDHRRLAERLRHETERRATAEAQLAEERKAGSEKLAVIKQAETALADAFKALSAEALKSNNRAFLDLTKTLLEQQETAKRGFEARRKAVDARGIRAFSMSPSLPSNRCARSGRPTDREVETRSNSNRSRRPWQGRCLTLPVTGSPVTHIAYPIGRRQCSLQGTLHHES